MFDGYIRDHARWTPRATAIVTPGRVQTYADFDADIDRVGAALRDYGVVAGCGVVALAIDLPYLHYVATCALARLGVPAAPGHDLGADIRVTDNAPGPEGPRIVRVDRDWTRAVLQSPHRPLPALDLDPDATGRVLLSSGTTAVPRRVAMTWRRIEACNHQTLRTYGAGKLGVWIPVVGIDALLGFSLCMAAWSVGAAATNALSCQELPAWLETLEPGLLGATPIQLRDILAALPDGFTPRPAWRIITGGSVLPPAIAREARLRITPDMRIIYGSTEASVNALGFASGLDDAPGLVGITPSGATVELLGPDGVPVPDGEIGEVRIRSNRMSHGYLGDPEGTAERFKDGWFHIGDLARRLPDGRLVIEGRADDRMNFGGIKFLPQTIELPALECPGVLDCAAFAAPGEDGIDHCWLAVATAPGFDRDSLARHLAGYDGLPENRFAWIDEIPRNAMGKVERARLRDALIAATRPG